MIFGNDRRSARPSRPSLTDSLTKSKRTPLSAHTGTRRSRPRWPAPLVEPGAVFTHLLALRRRRVALADGPDGNGGSVTYNLALQGADTMTPSHCTIVRLKRGTS